jgi:outer membrane biosynthesis protein TonB
MKMIIELGAIEAKNAIVSGALLGMLEVLADFEKETETPAREMVQQFNQPAVQAQPEPHPAQQPVTQPSTPTAPAQPQYQPTYQQAPIQQPIYPTSAPGTAVNPQPTTGPVQQQLQPQAPMQQPAAPMQQPAAPSIVPTSQAPTYSMDQLAVAATQLVDAGKIDQLRGILQSFNVTALTELPKERYGEFATVLRQNGVKI